MQCNERLKLLRQENGMQQSDVAEKIGIKTGTYSTYETGRCEPNGTVLKALSKLYGVSTDYILGLDDKKSTSLIDEVQRQISTLSEETLQELLNYVLYLKQRDRN